MKRCPKCNRTFPDENQKFCTVDGGLLIAAKPAFDPNATLLSTPAEVAIPEPSEKPTSRELPDPNATITASASAPTELFHRHTAPTDAAITADLPVAPVSKGSVAPVAVKPPPEEKKSKLPWILGGLLLLLLLGVGGAAAFFFVVIKPRLEASDRPVVISEPTPAENRNQNSTLENTNAATPEPTPEATPEAPAFVPPAGAVKFTNSNERLDGKLAEHYIDFSFYYPESWQVDPKAGVSGASNFVKVERRLPPDFTQENFAVGWYPSKGTFEADQPAFSQLVERLSASLSRNFPVYQKVSEGPTSINSLEAYEFRFVSLSKGTEKGDLQVWGRVVFVPAGVEGQTNGATLIMLSTSLAPELSGVQDVGVKGEMPVILESFRFAKK